MGRELKRVALDFNWPLEKTWEGFVNPHWVSCPACDGTGCTKAHHRVEDLVGLILLSGSDAEKGRCHPYFNHMEGLHKSEGVTCDKDMAELSAGLAGRPPSLFGHDAIDRWKAFAKVVEAAGLPKDWGRCKDCDGHGNRKDTQEIYSAWKATEPPKGEGYQIWETVSEGSPISPVFKTPEELASYMAGHERGKGSTYQTWLEFITGPGWAPSFVSVGGKFASGVEASNLLKEEE